MLTIGLLGRAGAGKDTVADLLSERYAFARHALADPLRSELSAAFGVDELMFRDPGLKDIPLARLRLEKCMVAEFIEYAWELRNLGALRPRTLMIAWGDWRRQSDPGYFLRFATVALHRARSEGQPALIVTDVRRQNELDWIRVQDGLLIRIVRPGLTERARHATELELSGTEADETLVNDGTIEDLRRQVIDVIGGLIDCHLSTQQQP